MHKDKGQRLWCFLNSYFLWTLWDLFLMFLGFIKLTVVNLLSNRQCNYPKELDIFPAFLTIYYLMAHMCARVCVCVRTHKCTHATLCLWSSKNNSVKFILSFFIFCRFLRPNLSSQVYTASAFILHAVLQTQNQNVFQWLLKEDMMVNFY